MHFFNRLLSILLLIAIGVFLGLNWQVYELKQNLNLAEVRQTQVYTANESSLERSFDIDRPHFNEVASTVTPSVVFIEASINMQKSLPKDGNHNFDEDFWRRFGPRRSTAAGSGIVISADGYILTNNHVIEDAIGGEITVHLTDRRQFEAQVVGTDPSTDLAVIKIDPDGALVPAIFGNSTEVEIGDWVLAIGNPLRLKSTVTAGIVSALGRSVDIINDRLRVESFIQTDAAINQGNSGGALVNVKGELIGVNTAIATRTGSYQGYGFAVPSNLARKVATDIIEKGSVQRALIGVSIRSVDYELANELGLEKIGGVLVAQVMRRGAADLAGMKERDIIIAVDDVEVPEVNYLQEQIALHKPGDVVELLVYRDGDYLRFEVQLQAAETQQPLASNLEVFNEPEMPQEPNSTREDSTLLENENKLELEEQESSPEEQDEPIFGLKSHKVQDFGFTVLELERTLEGLQTVYIISKVEPGSLSYNQGLRSGSTIVKIEGKAPTEMQEIIDLLNEKVQNNQQLSMLVEQTDGKRLQLFLRNR